MNALHALLIDDDENNLGVLTELLAIEGIVSTSVDNPSKLMPILSELKQIDLIFLDLEMPNSDGYHVLDILRRELGSEIRVIACTVHASEINKARELGFHSFLCKPLDLDRFPVQLKAILRNERIWDTKR